MHDMNEYSQRVIQQSVMSKIGLQIDNVVLQYVISLLAITMLATFTTKTSDWSQAIIQWS